MDKQVHIVLGTWGEPHAFHIYPFLDPDEAMQFVEDVQAYEVEQRAKHPQYTKTSWIILSETVQNAAETLAFHKAWMEE